MINPISPIPLLGQFFGDGHETSLFVYKDYQVYKNCMDGTDDLGKGTGKISVPQRNGNGKHRQALVGTECAHSTQEEIDL